MWLWLWLCGVSVAAAMPLCETPPIDAPITTMGPPSMAAGFRQPVFVAGDRSKPPGLLVVEQAGRIRRVDLYGGTPGAVFLDISERVTSGGETGLLGLALHPDFTRNGRFFVNYTTRIAGLGGQLFTRVSELGVESGSGRADPNRERVLL